MVMHRLRAWDASLWLPAHYADPRTTVTQSHPATRKDGRCDPPEGWSWFAVDERCQDHYCSLSSSVDHVEKGVRKW
jgi:hypothetical protein